MKPSGDRRREVGIGEVGVDDDAERIARWASSWSTRASASMIGVRMRLVNCAAVRSFGTSR